MNLTALPAIGCKLIGTPATGREAVVVDPGVSARAESAFDAHARPGILVIPPDGSDALATAHRPKNIHR